jgi:hypothetical protein
MTAPLVIEHFDAVVRLSLRPIGQVMPVLIETRAILLLAWVEP